MARRQKLVVKLHVRRAACIKNRDWRQIRKIDKRLDRIEGTI
jgi:hypothetical protein